MYARSYRGTDAVPMTRVTPSWFASLKSKATALTAFGMTLPRGKPREQALGQSLPNESAASRVVADLVEDLLRFPQVRLLRYALRQNPQQLLEAGSLVDLAEKPGWWVHRHRRRRDPVLLLLGEVAWQARRIRDD